MQQKEELLQISAVQKQTRRLPDWLKVRLPHGENYGRILGLVKKYNLHTVCQEAACPNIGECWTLGTATLMIMGDTCTRACRYCNVKGGRPEQLDADEPKHVAITINTLGLKYVVITCVTRDDLADGGAAHFVEVMRQTRALCPETRIELLTSDFGYDEDSIKRVADAKPYVFGHNIETVERIYKKVRPIGNYRKSIELLRRVKEINPHQLTKSSIMLGLGETTEEVIATLKDLRQADIDITSLGQYLQPSRKHANVQKFYTPEEFAELKKIALAMGFRHTESGPLVRSSYHAEKVLHETMAVH